MTLEVTGAVAKSGRMSDTGSLLLGIDLGPSCVTGTLVSPDRGIVACTSHNVGPRRDVAGWAEVDAKTWWQVTCEVIANLLHDAGASGADVVALSVSGTTPAVVVCDADGTPLRRVILQNDVRASQETRELERTLGHLNLLALTGSVLSQQSGAPTILWLSRNEPEIWSRTAFVQGSSDWLSRQFGASLYVEQNWALESGLYDLQLRPLDAIRTAMNITWPALLPVMRSGEIVGEVSARAATSSGLRLGTPIVVGGAEHVLSAFATGLVTTGDALITLGDAGDIFAMSQKLFLDRRLYLDAYPIPGTWLPNGSMATSGSVVRWEQSLFEAVPLPRLDEEARVSRPGALVSLPYFLGETTPLHDAELRGVIAGLHLGTTRGDLHRSFLEGVAYGFKSHVDGFTQGGLVLGDIRVSGAGSRSRLWRQILADILHHDLISISEHPGASYGAAVIAGISIGLISDWSYVEGASELGEIFTPDSENVTIYEERYQQFLQLSLASTPISHSLVRGSE